MPHTAEKLVPNIDACPKTEKLFGTQACTQPSSRPQAGQRYYLQTKQSFCIV